MVKMENGFPALQAAIDSSKELVIPLLVSSLTTSAAFLAFYLAEDTMGEIMGPLFSVITFSSIVILDPGYDYGNILSRFFYQSK